MRGVRLPQCGAEDCDAEQMSYRFPALRMNVPTSSSVAQEAAAHSSKTSVFNNPAPRLNNAEELHPVAINDLQINTIPLAI
jgi:hypothetical protein